MGLSLSLRHCFAILMPTPMRLLIYLLPALLLSLTACAQSLRLVTNLPTDLNENSGLVRAAQGRLWAHNDSGDSAKLYLLDTFGTIVRTLLVDGATHVDWEDIARDPLGRVYVGDMGNNNNNRRNLVIYRLPNLDTVTGPTVPAEAIRFYYPEQTAYPPPASARKYDAEALIYHRDSLYIFTKDRTSPHQGYTWLYQIPADTGLHAAVLLDSFRTGQLSFAFEVTGATLSPNQQQLALIGANRLWLFQHFQGSDFFGGTAQALPLPSITQKEAITFIDDYRVYISNENSFLSAARLHEMWLSNWVEVEQLGQSSPPLLFPNPTRAQVRVRLSPKMAGQLQIGLHALDGQTVKTWTPRLVDAGPQELVYELAGVAAGVYVMRLQMGAQVYVQRLTIGH